MFNKLQYEQELYSDLEKVPPKKYNLLRKEKASLCSEQQLFFASRHLGLQAVSIRAAASDQNRQNRQSIDQICCFSLSLSFGLKKRFEDVQFIDVTITRDINRSLNFDS